MDIYGQPHVHAASRLGEVPWVLIGEEIGWATEPVRTRGQREKFVLMPGNELGRQTYSQSLYWLKCYSFVWSRYHQISTQSISRYLKLCLAVIVNFRPVFFSLIAEECTEEAVSCMSKLYSALEAEGGIGRNIQNTKLRAQVLKTLYKFVESSNEMLLLQIARIILAVSNNRILARQSLISCVCALNRGSLCGNTDCCSFELVARICQVFASWYSRYPGVTRMTDCSWRTTFLVSIK